MTTLLAQQQPEYEDPEGLDNEGSGEYPIDSVLIRQEVRTVYDVVRRMKQDQYILNPEFQRDFIWDETKQSRLIESALMRIPLPVFYLAEQDDGKVVVVDGLQRLMTFNRYLNNEFALKGLAGRNQEFNGKNFDRLMPKLKTRLEDTNLILYLIDSKLPEQVRFDIFERVNGGIPLTRQQMRNCLYVGQATKWLREQAQSDWFLEATDRSLNPKTMRDREVINRFCGFYVLGVEYYVKDVRGDMDTFLARTLQHMNRMTSQDLGSLTQSFRSSMEVNHDIFGKYAFRKHTSQTQKRSVINVALFDVFSVMLANDQISAKRKAAIRKIFYALMERQDFLDTITLDTNSSRKVAQRFKIAKLAFEEM